MAAFTSVQSGNWNDGATWGNSSPGVKGTDWPGNAGDTFVVSGGHTVSYNVSETNELGASAINGKLSFTPSANTKLAFGNVTLSVGATGELEIGTSGTPIGASYTAEISFNTTSDNANGISVTAGGKYTVHGDPSYCAAWKTTLADNAENTDSDDTIITNDDMSSDWHVGDEITIKRESVGDSTCHTDAVLKAVIQSISGTQITVDVNVTGVSSGVGDTWVSTVTNVTRNVKLYKSGYASTVGNYNTNRPFFLDNNTSDNGRVLSSCQFSGFYRVTATYTTMSNVVLRNGYFGLYYSNNNSVSGSLYSCYYGLNGSKNNALSCDLFSFYYCFYSSANTSLSGNIYSCYTCFMSSPNNTVLGNIHSNNYGFYSSNNNIVMGAIYANATSLYTSNGNVLLGKMGYDDNDNSLPNTIDFRDCSLSYFLNCKVPAAGLVFYGRNTHGTYQRVQCEHHDQVLDAHKTYEGFGDITKTPCDGSGTSPSVDPDGGNDDCIEVGNLQSLCSDLNNIPVFNFKAFRIWAQASVSRTYTFKFQSTFTATLSNTEISLQGTYLSGADGGTTDIASTGTIAARGSASDWTQSLSVSVNPSQTGWVDFQVKLMKYESGAKIYIWPKVSIQ